jgi:hypothetical protein
MAGYAQDFSSYPVDRPLRLALAASIAFPDGSMTASGLRREAQRGRLVIERIAGKDYTTIAAIEKMREQCRVEAKGPASGCGGSSTIEPAGSRTRRYGSSKTANIERARDAAQMIVEGLKQRLPTTSRSQKRRPDRVRELTSRSPQS